MSKIINLTNIDREQIRRDFEEQLAGLKLSDGKITFTKTFGTVQRKATLYFTEMAYAKMLKLVQTFDKEVAWHGLAKRGDDETKDEYIIYDILVYPQEVTGAAVNTDQEKYQMWLMGQEDDVFNNIRMQGHSHVNMGTTPSSVDTSLYERLLDQLEDDMFYIFLIWNKRNDKTIKIYDMAKNILFETSDVDVSVLDDGTGLEAFMREAKEMVKDKVYASHAPVNYVGEQSRYGYSGTGVYSGNQQWVNSGVGAQKKEPAKDEQKKQKPVVIGGVKKKKKKKKGNSSFANACEEQESLFLRNNFGDDEDDFDNPYSAFGYR